MSSAPRRPTALSAGLLAAACALVPALAGCPGPSATPVAPDAGSAPPPAAPDAGMPPPLQLEVRYLAPDAGMALIAFAPGGDRPAIDPTSQLELSTNIGLQNYRIRLFDEVDRAMTSDDQMEEPGDRVRYRIQLPAPLKAGHRYALVVDAQTGSAIADSTGRLYPDQRLEFSIAGAREPDAPPRGTPGKRPVRKPPRHKRR